MQSKKQWAQFYDDRILELAMYQISEGLTLSVNSKEELYGKFSEFKKLIVRGSFTIEQLEESVYGRFGIMPPPITSFPYSKRDNEDEFGEDDINEFLQALDKITKSKDST